MMMTLTCPAFPHNTGMPAQYTCDGQDFSPELRWSDVPPETQGLALIVDDPDALDPAAPTMTWVHWVL